MRRAKPPHHQNNYKKLKKWESFSEIHSATRLSPVTAAEEQMIAREVPSTSSTLWSQRLENQN
jgi:hypothetical protein